MTDEHRLRAVENNVLIELFWHKEDYFLNTNKATLLNEQLGNLNRFLHFVMLGWRDEET
jgi:hypothetical protein